MFKQGEKIIKKKWKEKYGDASVEEVLGHWCELELKAEISLNQLYKN